MRLVLYHIMATCLLCRGKRFADIDGYGLILAADLSSALPLSLRNVSTLYVQVIAAVSIQTTSVECIVVITAGVRIQRVSVGGGTGACT